MNSKEFAVVPLAWLERFRKFEATVRTPHIEQPPSAVFVESAGDDNEDTIETQVNLVTKRDRERARRLIFHLKGHIKLDDSGKIVLPDGSLGPFLYVWLRYLLSREGFRSRATPRGISTIAPVLQGTEFSLKISHKEKWTKLY